MIKKELAISIMSWLLSCVMIFHLLVLFNIIPYDIVWAGKINSLEEMYVFESVSILINILILLVIRIKAKNLREHKTQKVINVLLWVFVVLFALNTLGNLFAATVIEFILGTFLTGVSSFLCWTIVRRPKLA